MSASCLAATAATITVSDNQEMKKISIIIIYLAVFQAIGKTNTSLIIFEDENLNISLNYEKKANVLSNDWLSIVFQNVSNEKLLLTNFNYFIKYEGENQTWRKGRQSCERDLTIYDVFPQLESYTNHSGQKQITFYPNEQKVCTRTISNIESTILGYKNNNSLNVNAKISVDGKYKYSQNDFEFQSGETKFKFVWTSHKRKYKKLADKLIQACDSIELRSNVKLISLLMKDKMITSKIPQEKYINIITKKQHGVLYYRLPIIKAYVKHYHSHERINQFYIKELANEETRLLEELYHYWDNSLHEHLTKSFLKSNTNHRQYLNILDNHNQYWKNDNELKSKLYNHLIHHRFRTLVDNSKLTTENIKFWQMSINQLKKSHSREAESYFKTFFNNKLLINDENYDPFSCHRDFKYYPTVRACDAALEAYLFSKSSNIKKKYIEKYEQLVEENILRKPIMETKRQLHENVLLDKQNMLIIRDKLLEDYR